MKNIRNHWEIHPNESPPALNDFSRSKINAPVHIGPTININPPPSANAGSTPTVEDPGKEAKESRTSTKSRVAKIVLIGVGTISVISVIAFALVRCKDELTQDGLIAVCQAINSAFSFFSLLFSK